MSAPDGTFAGAVNAAFDRVSNGVGAVLAQSPRQTVVVHRDDMRIAPLPEVPTPVARHHFHDVGDFCNYVGVQAAQHHLVVFVDAEKATLTAAAAAEFYPDAPLLTCGVSLHPHAEVWFGKILGRRLSEKALAALLRQVAPTMMAVAEQFALTVRTLGAKRVTSSDLDVTEVGFTRLHAKTEQADITIPIPTSFKIVTPWYASPVEDPPVHEIEIVVEVEVDEKADVYLTLSAPQLALSGLRAVGALVEYIQGRLPDHLIVRGAPKIDTVKVPSQGSWLVPQLDSEPTTTSAGWPGVPPAPEG